MENYREAMLAWQEHEEHDVDCDKLQVYSISALYPSVYSGPGSVYLLCVPLYTWDLAQYNLVNYNILVCEYSTPCSVSIRWRILRSSSEKGEQETHTHSETIVWLKMYVEDI